MFVLSLKKKRWKKDLIVHVGVYVNAMNLSFSQFLCFYLLPTESTNQSAQLFNQSAKYIMFILVCSSCFIILQAYNIS